MQTHVIDLRQSDDARDVVHRAVQALAEGRTVGFPTETDYVIAAAARQPATIERLTPLVPRRAGEPLLSLGVKSAAEALDWAPRLSPLGRRIARRCWPGPVAIVVADDHPESLVHRLPEVSRRGLLGGGRLRLRVPGHPMLGDCMRMLAGPVVLAEPAAADQSPAVTAEELIERSGSGLDIVIDDGRSRYAQPMSVIEVGEHDFRMLRSGIVSEETVRRLSSVMVLFVCTGNTCRSPMAEALFRQMVAERLGCRYDEIDAHGVMVGSAGVAAWAGGRASTGALETMADFGIDLSGHESQPLTEQLVRQADVIWTMTASHRAAVLAQFPEAGDRVAVLSPDRADVVDPIGGPLETYRTCARQIQAHLKSRIDTLGLRPGRSPE
jgi:protein-tyrosine-phosphatase/tRNA A37 threonylcarbamoyladenosine synthetase subunit TsaC/SUA5/YrdC